MASSKASRDDVLDRYMMTQAIRLARRGQGRVEPNPLVGCVIVKKGRVIGRGAHLRFGGPHAEIVALRSCKENPRKSTVYVSLEPCSHHGKTPPCADALVEAGVKRVVVGLRDPNPVVSGRGIRRLLGAGILVATGVGKAEALETLAPYITRLTLNRPYVIAKWAQSLDGKLATRTGDSRWISGPESRRHAHRLRARVDAILVGSGTVLSDDPMLTARDVPLLRRAVRIVVDSRLRTPEKCQLVKTAKLSPTLIVTTRKLIQSAKAGRLRKRGVELLAARVVRKRIALEDCLAKLAKRDVTNLMVEGGPTLLSELLSRKLVDEAHVYTAPILIGGSDSLSVWPGRAAGKVTDSTALHMVETKRLGKDNFSRFRFI